MNKNIRDMGSWTAPATMWQDLSMIIHQYIDHVNAMDKKSEDVLNFIDEACSAQISRVYFGKKHGV